VNSDDIEAIKQLKYRYLRTLDLKQWDDFAECFLPEATGDYAGLLFEDRSALVAYMRENLGEGLISMHHAHHPEITVDGDSADGRWYLEDKVIVPDFDFVLEGAAFYTDRYARAHLTAGGSRTPATGAPTKPPCRPRTSRRTRSSAARRTTTDSAH
jgi:hypothetical protein